MTRTGDARICAVAVTTALGRTSRYEVETRADGSARWKNEGLDGLASTVEFAPDRSMSSSNPDGTSTETVLGPDPRFGMAAPIMTQTIRTPSGLKLETRETQIATLEDSAGLFAASALGGAVAVNSRSWSWAWDRANRTVESTSSAGRRQTARLDERGRVIEARLPEMLPVELSYDAHGRPVEARQATRVHRTTWGADGFVETTTDSR